MATVQCLLQYDAKGNLVKTFQIKFDQNDKIEIRTATPNLALKSEDAQALKLVKSWNGNGGGAHTLAQAQPGEYDPPEGPALNGIAKTESFTFSFPADKVAHFQCGYRVNNVFQPDPKAKGQGVPVVP
jgi:hypothetical protein